MPSSCLIKKINMKNFIKSWNRFLFHVHHRKERSHATTLNIPNVILEVFLFKVFFPKENTEGLCKTNVRHCIYRLDADLILLAR